MPSVYSVPPLSKYKLPLLLLTVTSVGRKWWISVPGPFVVPKFPRITSYNVCYTKLLRILKIVVLNRYSISKPVVGFIKNIGLKKGALACSIAHDSHNLIAVGVSDDDISYNFV